MPDLREVAQKVRSKNAGPFWLTIDIFCGTAEAFDRISAGLDTAAAARALNADSQTVKRFDIAELAVIKLSLPRPVIQGAPEDRDMHGAAWAEVIAGLEIP